MTVAEGRVDVSLFGFLVTLGEGGWTLWRVDRIVGGK